MLEAIGFIVLWIIRIILYVLAFALLLVMALLFVPLRYHSEGEFREKVDLQIRCSWLLKIFRFSYRMQDGSKENKLKVLFWQVYPKKKSSLKKRETKSESARAPMVKNVVESQEALDGDKRREDELKEKEPVQNAAAAVELKDKEQKVKEPKEEEGSFSEKLRPQIDKLKMYYAFLQEKENEQVIPFLMQMIKKLLLALFPRKARANLTVGLEDPASTGYLAALTSILYVKTATKVHIIPDFQQKIMQGTYQLKGKVYLYQLIYYIMRVVLDRRVKRLIKMVKEK